MNQFNNVPNTYDDLISQAPDARSSNLSLEFEQVKSFPNLQVSHDCLLPQEYDFRSSHLSSVIIGETNPSPNAGAPPKSFNNNKCKKIFISFYIFIVFIVAGNLIFLNQAIDCNNIDIECVTGQSVRQDDQTVSISRKIESYIVIFFLHLYELV
jgi:hypothetical protein